MLFIRRSLFLLILLFVLLFIRKCAVDGVQSGFQTGTLMDHRRDVREAVIWLRFVLHQLRRLCCTRFGARSRPLISTGFALAFLRVLQSASTGWLTGRGLGQRWSVRWAVGGRTAAGHMLYLSISVINSIF